MTSFPVLGSALFKLLRDLLELMEGIMFPPLRHSEPILELVSVPMNEA